VGNILMSLFSALLLLVVFSSMAIIAILLVNALISNYRTGQEVRNELAKRIELLPFGKMLKSHNVELPKFLHKIPLTEIESEIKVCQSCSKTVECNKAQNSNSFENEVLNFCPNSQVILQQKATCYN
jgi:hypothetical protein